MKPVPKWPQDHFQSFGATNTDWVAELIRAASDPLTGQSYLDRRIPEVVKDKADIVKDREVVQLEREQLYANDAAGNSREINNNI